jgi:hypothetical protein
MQNYSGSSNLSPTVFFTAPPGDASVYMVSVYLTVTGTGDDVTASILKNGHGVFGLGAEQDDDAFQSYNVLLSENDELKVSVSVNGTFSWSLQLRLVKILDELAPLE